MNTRNTTKQILKRRYISAGVLLCLFSLLLSTCKAPFGLGTQVDIGAPVLTVESPSRNLYVNGVLTIMGTASDDIEVSAVNITVKRRNQTITELTAVLDGESWSANLDTSSGTYDGEVSLEVTAKDPHDKTSTVIIPIFVDNKAPTVLVTSPLTNPTNTALLPIYTEAIDLKGEVWDQSSIASVQINLYKSNGSLLTGPILAEGTNSWSVRIPLKDALAGLIDGANYAYSVTATDIAGNANTWYYHRSDILSIKDPSSLFPAMDELGKLEQQNVIGASGITASALSTKRLNTSSSWARFKYEADPQIDFDYSNINRGETAADNILAPGSKLSGLISPPPNTGAIDNSKLLVRIFDLETYTTNPGTAVPIAEIRDSDPDSDDDNLRLKSAGSAVSFTISLRYDDGTTDLPPNSYALVIYAETDQGNNATDYQEFFLDAEVPLFEETTINPTILFKNSGFQLRFNGSHSTALSKIDIFQSFNGGAEENAGTINIPGNPKNFTDLDSPILPAGAQGDGLYNYRLVLSTTGGKTATLQRSITYDSTAPTLAINGLNPVVYEESLEKVNGQININIGASDNNGVDSVRLWLLPSVQTPTWSDGNQILSWTNPPYSGSLLTSTIADGPAKIWILAYDRAGNLASYSKDLVIDQSSDRPKIQYDNLDPLAALNRDNGFGQHPVILLTVSDDDQVKVSELQYRIDADNDGLFTTTSAPITLDTKWANETVWHAVEEVPATDRALAQVKIKLTDFPQGAFRIQIRARDSVGGGSWASIYGNPANTSWTESPVIRFAVDYGPPSISVTQPAAGTYRDNIPISGTASDGLGVSYVRYTMDGGNTYIDLFTGAGSDTSAPFSSVIPTGSLASGEYILQIEAMDVGGTSANQQIPITIDRTPPTVSILQPGTSAVINGPAVLVRGEASDNRQLGAVFLWHGLVSAPDPAVLPSRTGPGTYNAGSYSQVSGSSVWQHTINTTATAASPADGYRIRMVAVDAIGNVSTPIDHLLTVNQESDRPLIAFSNLSIPGPSRLALGNLSIIGTVSDDDSVNHNSIQIRIDRNGDGDFDDTNEGWVAVSDPPSSSALLVSWVHNITDLNSEGLHHVQVRARDIYAADYSSGYGWNVSAVVPFMIDNGPPALTVSSPTLSQKFNVADVNIIGTSQDTNGLKRVVVWVDRNENAVVDAGEQVIVGKAMDNSGSMLTTDNTLYNFNIPIASIPNGVKTVRVIAYDGADAITVREFSIVVDTQAPTATINAPSAASTQNGSIPVVGTAADNIQVAKVYWSLALSSAGAPAFPAAYTLLAGQSYAWNFNLDTTGYPDGEYTLRLVIEDGAGNTNAATPQSVTFNINQATDRPVISVLTLNAADPAALNLLPPSLTVSGTISDDDSVDRTKIQIRSRGLPAVGDTGWSAWTAISGIPASNSALVQWSHTFTGFSDGLYQFELRAADILDTGGWTDGAFSWSKLTAVEFAIDTSLPVSTITSPVQASFHRSNINISGVASDASGIKKVTIAYDTGSGYGAEVSVYNDADPNDGYNNPQAWNTSYPVSNGDGQVFFRLSVTDAFDKVRTYEQYFTVDTQAPTVGFQLPSAGATLNGSVMVRGTAGDTNQVSQVWIKVNNAAGPGTWTAPSDPAANGWTLANGSYTWDHRFRSTSLADGAATIYVMAIDTAGNRSDPTNIANQLAFTINQSANLPVITLTTPNNALLDNGGVITGTVSDDDGVDTATLQISFDNGSTWRPVSNPGSSGLSVSFSHALSAGAGLAERDTPYTVLVRVSDIGENFDGGDFTGPQDIAPVSSTSAAISIRKDDGDPVLSVNSLNNGISTVSTLQGAYISSILNISGTASDGVRVASVEARLPGVDTDFLPATNNGTNFSTWSWNRSGLVLASGSQSLEVRVTDVNGRFTTQTFTLLVDTTKPTVGFESTSTNPDTASGSYNGNITFRGMAGDNVQIGKVYYRFQAADPGAPDSAFTGWSEATGTFSWSVPLNTLAIHNAETNLNYGLWITAVDSAGNVADRQNLAFVINQASDRPNAVISSPAEGQVLGENAKLQMLVNDDDGIASIEIRIDRNNDGDFDDLDEGYVPVSNPVSPSGRSLSADHDLSTLADGAYRLQIRVRDSLYTTTLSALNQFESAVIGFSIDSTPPALSLERLTIQDLYGGADRFVENAAINGSYVNNDFILRFNATDNNGIARVQTSLDNSTWTDATHAGGNNYDSSLAIAAFANGTRTIYYRAQDNNNRTTSGIITLLIDKTSPTINFSSPAGISSNSGDDAPNVNGTAVLVTGNISDSSVIESLSIIGGIDQTNNPIVFANSGDNSNWSISFNATLYQNATYAVETGAGSNVWRLPITLTAWDAAGNRSIRTGYVDIDPDGDKPIVNITAPGAGASVTGIVTVMGIFSDDDGPNGTVNIGLDTNNNGLFDDQIFNDVVVENGAWVQQINTGGTLNGIIGIRVTPTDSLGRSGDPVTRSFFVDSSLPLIVGYDGSSETAAPSPASGTRQRGTITIRALFKDDDNLPEANLQVSLDGGNNYVAISGQPGYSRVQLADAGGKKRYDVSFEVNTATYFANNAGNGSMSVILSVTDNTYKPAVVSLNYAVDNRPPEAYWDPDSTLAAPQAGIYSFFGSGQTNNNKLIGSALDGGAVSGIKHVDVFFVKNNATLYDPKTGLGIAVPLAQAADRLYTKLAFDGTAINTGTDTITLDRSGWGTVNNNLPVRFVGSSLPGGLDANKLYYVRDIVGNSFRVYTSPTGGSPVDLTSAGSGLMEYSVYDVPYTDAAYLAGGGGTNYAIRIDRRTELGANDGNANGDGDGFQESLKDSGGYDEWFAYFNSTVLPDGPITVYYVASDNNDNKVIGRTLAQIANNPPSITSFVVGGNSLSGNPIKVKYAGNVNLTINAQDIGGNAGIVGTSWRLSVVERFGDNGSGDINLADPKALTAWYYGQNTGGNWKSSFSSTSGGTPASGIVDINTASDFVEGDWYRLEASVVDNDGNTASRSFYMRVNNNDTTPPVVSIGALDQTAVSQWTSKLTPLSIDIPAANVNAGSDTINVALPAYIPNNTRLMFAGTATPGGLNNTTVYFLVNKTGSSFQLSLSSNGPAVDISAAGAGTYQLVSGGHLEAAGDSQISARAAVSGAILLRGTVSDDSDVQSLTISIDGSAPVTLTPFNKNGNAVTGYSYDWQYLWDSSRITTVAKTNVSVVLTAADFSASSADSTATINVDVVPHITTITDPTGLSNDVLRGATGRYSIASHPSNRLTVRGYNLGRTGYLPAVRNSAAAGSWASGTLGAASTFNSVNEILVTKDWLRSGWLTVVVNGVPSGNNLNNNANLNNKEDTADPRSAQWNDDRYLWVWDTRQINITTATGFTLGILSYSNPDMMVNPANDQPEFSWNDINAGNTLFNTSDSAATRRYGFRVTRPAAMAKATVGAVEQRFILSSMDAVVSVAGDLQAGFFELTGFENQTVDGYTSAQSPSTENNGQKWMTIQGTDYYRDNGPDSKDYRVFNRIMHPKLITETSATIGGTPGANIFVSYYDGSPYPGFQSLQFLAFRATGQRAGNLVYPGNDYSRSTDVLTIPGTSDGRSSQYYSMVKLGNDGAIAIAYYDAYDRSLKLAYSTNAYQRTPAAAATHNKTVQGTREVTTMTVTGDVLANWAGKYFTVHTDYQSWDIYYHNGDNQRPAGATSAQGLGVSLAGITGNAAARRAEIANRTRLAINTTDAANPAASYKYFTATGAGDNVIITQVVAVNVADANIGNLASGTTVATLTTNTQGASTWSGFTIDSSGDVGRHVSMTSDGNNLYLAYYDFDNTNLKFAKVAWNSGSPSLSGIVEVDSYLSAGTWTNITMMNNQNLTGQNSLQPVIAYYSDSYSGTLRPIRFAFPRFNAATGILQAGAEYGSYEDSYTGNWEVITVPSITIPQGGADTFNKVQLGKYSSETLPVVGWLGSRLEYGKLMPNN